MSIYTPAPPDHHAVLEGVAHFRKLEADAVPAYADVHTWSRGWIDDSESDPRFLEADITALADAVIRALKRAQPKPPTKDWRQKKSPNPPSTPPAQPATGVQ